MGMDRKRVKKALYDAGVALLIKKNGGVKQTLSILNETAKQRTKKQSFDLREKIIQIGNKDPDVFLNEIL